MSANRQVLAVIPVPGLQPNSLGTYLAALGLLKVLSGRWPNVRAAWRDGVFQLIGGPTDRDALVDVVMTVAGRASWTPYKRGWAAAQKASTKTKSSAKLALWQAEADEADLELFAAHAAPASRVFFNPLLGSGGNAGKRAFSNGWNKAIATLLPPKETPKKGANTDDRREALNAFLDGKASAWRAEKLNAASWFSDANKLYNSGQNPFTEGTISPWAMALACEGLVFFAGSASRRLGSRTRPIGAFPFVVAAASPETSGEAGRDRGEVWVPLWSRPMTVPEVTALFARGRAEISGHGVVTPAAFAVAITQRGVDAGISEFRRFALGKTTSANTFEPRYLGAAPVRVGTADAQVSAFERILGLIESLPRDRKEGQRWRFVGLRGPVERTLVNVTHEQSNSEATTALLDAIVQALDRVDVNRSFREKGVTWRPLPLDWVPALFGGEIPNVEAHLALSLASAFPIEFPFALYRFGIEWQDQTKERRPRKNSPFIHSKTPPARWVWRTGSLAQNLCMVIQRRLLDWEGKRGSGAAPALRAPIAARVSDVEAWLDGDVDEAILARWLSRLALFDWSFIPQCVLELSPFASEVIAVCPALALYAFLHPLFDLRPVTDNGRKDGHDLLAPETGARTPVAALRMAALIRGGDIDRAIEVARSRYAMAQAPLMRTDAPWAFGDPDRLLAALMFPISNPARTALVRRWLRPQRQTIEVTHA
ncbi:MAG: type I-G CRISPR-associated protein Cas8g1/Csx17 [Terriglobales bacterium]